jgi:hypothetical protein
MTFIFTMFVLM